VVRPVRVTTQSASQGGDLTFDNDGFLVMASGRDIVRVAKGRSPMVLVENALGFGRTLFGVRVMTDGTVFMTDNETDIVFRFGAGGVRRTFTMDAPIQFVRGPAGGLYVTGGGGEVFHFDMDTERTRVLARINGALRGITFSADYRTIYVAERNNSTLYSMAVRPDGSLESPRVLTRNLGSSPDGLATDICGNVYVADRTGDPLVRVTPAGRVEEVADIGAPLSGLAFGSGKQGWDDRALYAISEARGNLFEIRVGVRGALPPAPVD
jgi:streptogramin lyase